MKGRSVDVPERSISNTAQPSCCVCVAACVAVCVAVCVIVDVCVETYSLVAG